jgi:hypothetical protein
LISSTVCVENQTIVANIVSSKLYTRNLLVAFIFYNSHFYVQNYRFRALFCRFTANQAEIQKSTSHSMFTNPWACYIPKMTFLAFPQKKPYIKTSKKHPFSAHSTRLVTPEVKIEKNSSHSLKFRQFSGFSPNFKTFRYKLSVNQMVGGSSTELPNGIARSRIDLSYVLMRNVLPSSV